MTLEYYGVKSFAALKVDGSPITEADKASNEILNRELKRIRDLPILSEENNILPYDVRRNWDSFWLVDPLDGTKEFLNANGEFTINVALIEKDKPAVGVVYAPAKSVVYFSTGGGSFRKDTKTSETTRIKSSKTRGDILRVVVSRSHLNLETKAFIVELKKVHDQLELVVAGSSLKICLVAEGSADIYPRFGTTMEWDTAAAHVIARYAGKKVFNVETKEELTYNKEDLRNPWFIVE
ncbi:MAG: 3'(2'),5'-bisphosphate nucleotidase CysQ [Candidatus Altiarchaeales archaeon]|nr:3'(2'),5'-bisphosphate nucleotidase CysQ [Candidatus Altiarchaeales archaeon]